MRVLCVYISCVILTWGDFRALQVSGDQSHLSSRVTLWHHNRSQSGPQLAHLYRRATQGAGPSHTHSAALGPAQGKTILWVQWSLVTYWHTFTHSLFIHSLTFSLCSLLSSALQPSLTSAPKNNSDQVKGRWSQSLHLVMLEIGTWQFYNLETAVDQRRRWIYKS